MKTLLQLAGCILTDHAGGVLLLHRNTPKRTQWEIPGGKVEPGESTEEATIREIREELGVTVRLIRQLGAKEFSEDQSTLFYTWFLGAVEQGSPSIGEPHMFDDLRYFTLPGLESIHSELSPNAKNFLDSWSSGELNPLA